MGRSKLESISDFARTGMQVRVTCPACHHAVEINPVILMQKLQKARRSQQVEAVERQMRCRLCHHRGATITATLNDF